MLLHNTLSEEILYQVVVSGDLGSNAEVHLLDDSKRMCRTLYAGNGVQGTQRDGWDIEFLQYDSLQLLSVRFYNTSTKSHGIFLP